MYNLSLYFHLTILTRPIVVKINHNKPFMRDASLRRPTTQMSGTKFLPESQTPNNLFFVFTEEGTN